jgi:hypothetical protein
MTEEIKEMDLEELIAQTEQKILNNEYYEDVDVEYRDTVLHVRIRPISQSKFIQITKNQSALKTAEFHSLLIKECVLNKFDNKPFTMQQINEFFTGGLASLLALKCIEISGITLDKEQLNKLKKF